MTPDFYRSAMTVHQNTVIIAERFLKEAMLRNMPEPNCETDNDNHMRLIWQQDEHKVEVNFEKFNTPIHNVIKLRYNDESSYIFTFEEALAFLVNTIYGNQS